MRCYNGQPDKKLQDVVEQEKESAQKILKMNSEAHCTYHHPQCDSSYGYQWHEWGKPIGKMCPNFLDACDSALNTNSNMEKI